MTKTALILIVSHLLSFGAAEASDASKDAFFATVVTQARENPWKSTVTVLPARECCKVCSRGKACGDTCIAQDNTCHVGPGCACDG